LRSCAVLDFADEASLVQTRFATTALALLRAHLGDDVRTLARDAEALLTAGAPLGDVQYEHFVFLGEGFGAALAHEAALKMRETAGAWTEAYAAPEYRHGPVSAAAEQTLVWALGPVGDDVLEHAERTGAHVRASDRDPMVELVVVHLQAELEARRRGRDIDNPPFLSRSVVLG
jgi:CRISPR-associated protein Cas5a/b/c